MAGTRRRLAIVLSVVLLAAGCAGPSGEDPSQGTDGETDDTYFLVHVEGNETHDPPPGHVCDVAFDHRLDEDDERLNYSNHTYDNMTDPGLVMAFDVWDESTHCPIAYSLHAGFSEVETEIGRYGNLTLAPREDGSVVVNADSMERELGPGDRFEETYEAQYEDSEGRQVNVSGQFVVEHLGSWPTDRLEPEK